jgi:hypothetical protein
VAVNSIMDLVTQELTGGNLSKISQHVGADPSTTQQGLSAAVPLLVSGLARNASQPQGAQALHQAVSQNHNGQILRALPRTPASMSGRRASCLRLWRPW